MYQFIYRQGLCVGSDQSESFFSESPNDLARAQEMCFQCPVRIGCLEAALKNNEEWGVWGGVIFWDGQPFYRKRARGRPCKQDAGQPLEADRQELWALVRSA